MEIFKQINLQSIPQKPGVYQFRGETDELLYIGKAKNLKSRISSYFHKSASLAPDKKKMISLIKKVEFIITSSDTEALLLESNLIKKHQPPYNIDLKDDKHFLFIKITVHEEFPRVFTVRRILDDKAKYFGPYASAFSVKNTLHTLRKLFPHRNFPKAPNKRQLENWTKRYPQLIGPSDPSQYQKTIQKIIKFLKGDYREIVRDLKKTMEEKSKQKKFEQAAEIRDKIRSIEKMMEKQKVISTKNENQDIISIAQDKNKASINLFAIRHGKLLAKQNFLLTNTVNQKDEDVLQAFIERLYSQNTNLPEEIIIPKILPNVALLKKAFKLSFVVPMRGIKKQYLNLGFENAVDHLEQQKASWEKDNRKIKQALLEFKKTLKLITIPRRIETFDISNIQGTDAVGSMVVFTEGQPDKKWYRKFRIKTIQGANDPAMMAEVIQRRFKHIQGKPNNKKWPRPDLIIIDGGKAQLNAVLKNVPKNIPVISLAKRREDIYIPDKKMPVNFPDNSEALFLIQRMRDEAHRFAINFYRKKHNASIRQSTLDNLPGIGPLTKKKLIKYFGTIRNTKEASLEELTKVVGKKIALIIHEQL